MTSLDKLNGTAVQRGRGKRNALSLPPAQERARTISVFVLLVPFFFTSLALLLCQRNAVNTSEAVTVIVHGSGLMNRSY